MYRRWAFWRRVQYVLGILVFLLVLGSAVYVLFLQRDPTCFDGVLNGDERGVDCGGGCRLVCAADVEAPVIQWSRAFPISKGVYNVVGYLENRNRTVGTKKLEYTFTLVDEAGATIVEKKGTTFLPPDSVYPIFEGRVMTGNRVPARTLLTLSPVAEWEVFEHTRDQFVVSASSLSGADSKPRLDASITNTLIRDERDVEVVATIFNTEGTALTASRTVVPLFEGRLEKKVVFTWPEPIAKTLRSCEVPTDVMMAIDLSGSMNNDGGTPPEPVTSALRAASSFVSRLNTRDQVGVVTFATQASLARTLISDKESVGTSITALAIDPKDETGGTNIGDAIIYATGELQSPRHNTDARKVLIVFTDGKATSPDVSPETYALDAVQKAKDAGIEIFSIGLGKDLNQEFLTQLASKDTQRFIAPDTAALDGIYRSISTAICEAGPAVIDIVPKVIGGLNDGR